MLNPWDPQTAPVAGMHNIYDMGWNNPLGLSSSGGTWDSSALMLLQGRDAYVDPLSPFAMTGNANNTLATANPLFNWQRPTTEMQRNPGVIQNFLQNEATARQVFGLGLPGQQSGSGGGTQPGGGSGNSAAPRTAPNSGAPASAPSNQAIGGGVNAGLGGPTASPAVTGANSSGWLSGAMKWTLANKNWISGLLTAVGTAYSQSNQKKQARQQYDYANSVLQQQRDYYAQQQEAIRNSPVARMAGPLMDAVLQMYAERLGRYNVNLPLQEILGGIRQATGRG